MTKEPSVLVEWSWNPKKVEKVTAQRSALTPAKIASIVRATKKAGMSFVRVEIEGEKIVVTEVALPTSEPQNELDRWRAKRAR